MTNKHGRIKDAGAIHSLTALRFFAAAARSVDGTAATGGINADSGAGNDAVVGGLAGLLIHLLTEVL